MEDAMTKIKLLVIDRKNMVVHPADSFEQANFIAEPDGLGPEAIAWAIQEYGRCDGHDYTIIPQEWEDKENMEKDEEERNLLMTHDQRKMVRLAERFYSEAEAPSKEDMSNVFYALVQLDLEGMAKILREFGLEDK